MSGGDRGPPIGRAWLVPGGGELPELARDARRRWSSRRGVVIAIEVGGVVGLGEASPLPGFSLDDVTDAARALEEVARRLVGVTVAVEPGADALDVVEHAIDRLSVELPAAGRLAVETALLDALGQQRGQPVAVLLGADATARLEVSALLGDPGASDALARATTAIASGARSLKLKLGSRPVAADVAAVAALRAAIGPGVALTGDANGAWAIPEARAAATALAPLGVVVVEQPVAPADLAGLGEIAIPTWADESLTPPGARAAVLAMRHVAGVVLKPTVLGGLAAARRVARAAAAAGKGVVVTHALEGPIALRACSALALALASVDARGAGDDRPSRGARAGLWPHAGLGAWPAVGAATIGAELAVDPRPGLGLDRGERAALLAAGAPTDGRGGA